MPTALTYLYTSRENIEDVLSSLGLSLRLDYQQSIQRVAISGSPSAGSYTLSWNDGTIGNQTTAAIAYNAPEADVQAALRLLTGLESIQVVSSGTSPNFTHRITMTGVDIVPVPLMTAASSLTGGAIAVGSILAASDTAMQRVLNEVTAFANKFLKNYKPYIPANAAILADNWDINRICTDLGVCRASMYLGNPVPQSFKARCDAAIADLKSYLDGTSEVPGFPVTSPVGALTMVNQFKNEGTRPVINPRNWNDEYRVLVAAWEGDDPVLLDETLRYNTSE